MLDPGMAEFQAAMQVKARPRRAGTRQVEIDFSSAPGAALLARRIVQFWAAAGVTVKTEIIRCGGPPETPIFGIRSNLLNALPPQGGANGHPR